MIVSVGFWQAPEVKPAPSITNRFGASRAWAADAGPARGSLPGGFKFYVHGFGCAVDGPEWGVDFDFGAAGEIDGFDATRLHDFARKRLADYGFRSEAEIDESIKSAERAGSLRFSGYILYHPVR